MWDAFISIMINSLLFIYNLVGQNFGWAIIIFTVLVRVITYPLTAKQMKSSQAMQELQNSKKWADIQKKYKDDKETLAQKQMEIYREMGINPLGSCLPLLIQFPIIIGLYQAIIRALAVTPIQLVNLSKHISNGATLIPIRSHFWWMELSEPERLPILGVGIPVLAILVVITSYPPGRRRTGSSNDSGDDPLYALLYGVPGSDLCLRPGAIFHCHQPSHHCPIYVNGTGQFQEYPSLPSY
jgi:YidC/Oxa1 family membrane protein insertase